MPPSCGSESTELLNPPHSRSERRRRRAKRGASGTRLWKVGLRISADSRATERAGRSIGRAGTMASRAGC
eukprot:7031778-Alexandrium_andersonii.AAC.1